MSFKQSKPRGRAASAFDRLRGRGQSGSEPEPPARPEHSDLDRWLTPLFGERLEEIESGLVEGDEAGWGLFRELDDDLWALLLTLEYDDFPGIRSFLPALPPRSIQEKWNGASGPALAAQSVAFYRKLKEIQGRFGQPGLADAKVLDVGCGWGRLTRMLARDLKPGNLYGCDPVEEILDVCRETGVPARLERSEFLPERFPFETDFDLIFAFSVLTHVSEPAAKAALRAAAKSLEPGGLFVFTIRPASYFDVNPLMAEAAGRLGSPYVFVAHPAEDHPQYAGEEMTYGESIITLPWIEEHSSDEFEITDVAMMTADIYQVVVTLRKK